MAFKDFPPPCKESAAHRETVYPDVPLPINTLSFCSGILDQEGDMFARTSLCRNTGMSEIKWPRIILWDSMRPCLASGSKGNVSPLNAGEHCNKLLCLAFHFSSCDTSVSFANNADSKTRMQKHYSSKRTMSRLVCSLFLQNTMTFWLW